MCLILFNQTNLSSLPQCIYINDQPIRIFVDELFNSEELAVLYPNLSVKIKYTVDQFKTNFENLREKTNYQYVTYRYLLAVFQRIRLPLELSLKSHLPLKNSVYGSIF
jgi:hypothetical protein